MADKSTDAPSIDSQIEPVLAVTEAIDAILSPLYYHGDGLVYHYCSAETALAILSRKTLRFGDATCMNDGEEIIWADKQVKKAVSRLRDRDDIPDELPAISKSFAGKFLIEWDRCVKISKQFLSCFSKDGDSLSQWRAYADNAKGFSIGFDWLNLDIPAQILQVNYKENEQQNYLMNSICEMYKIFKNNKDYFDDQGMTDINQLYGQSSAFKNPAFEDEREIRAAHLALLWADPGKFPAIEFSGGIVNGKDIDDGDIEFRHVAGRIIPYIDFPFQIESECAIKEIWLGPRCPMSVFEVKVMLGTLGYSNIEVKVAGSKYR